MVRDVTGYRKKPQWIFWLTWLYLVLPFFSRFAFWYRHRGFVADELFYLDWLISWSGATAVFVVTRFSIHIFAVLSGIMMALQYFAASSGWIDPVVGYGTFWIWCFTALLLIFTPAERPYLYPQTRWWLQPDRYSHVMLGVLEYQTVRFPVVILNICRDGIFLKLDQRQPGGRTQELSHQESAERRNAPFKAHPLMSAAESADAFTQLNAYPSQIGREVILELAPNLELIGGFKSHILTSQAAVVWTALPRGFYRYGLGLKFIRQSKMQKQEWEDYLAKIRTIKPPKR